MLCAKLSLVKVTGFPAEVITVCDFFWSNLWIWGLWYVAFSSQPCFWTLMWSEQHLGVKCQRPDWVTDVCDRRILQVQLRGRFSRRLESDLSDVQMLGMSAGKQSLQLGEATNNSQSKYSLINFQFGGMGKGNETGNQTESPWPEVRCEVMDGYGWFMVVQYAIRRDIWNYMNRIETYCWIRPFDVRTTSQRSLCWMSRRGQRMPCHSSTTMDVPWQFVALRCFEVSQWVTYRVMNKRLSSLVLVLPRSSLCWRGIRPGHFRAVASFLAQQGWTVDGIFCSRPGVLQLRLQPWLWWLCWEWCGNFPQHSPCMGCLGHQVISSSSWEKSWNCVAYSIASIAFDRLQGETRAVDSAFLHPRFGAWSNYWNPTLEVL